MNHGEWIGGPGSYPTLTGEASAWSCGHDSRQSTLTHPSQTRALPQRIMMPHKRTASNLAFACQALVPWRCADAMHVRSTELTYSAWPYTPPAAGLCEWWRCSLMHPDVSACRTVRALGPSANSSSESRFCVPLPSSPGLIFIRYKGTMPRWH